MIRFSRSTRVYFASACVIFSLLVPATTQATFTYNGSTDVVESTFTSTNNAIVLFDGITGKSLKSDPAFTFDGITLFLPIGEITSSGDSMVLQNPIVNGSISVHLNTIDNTTFFEVENLTSVDLFKIYGDGAISMAPTVGTVAIGTAAVDPSNMLTVAGNLNLTSTTFGYKSNGTVILIAPTTTFGTFVGAGAGAASYTSGLFNTAVGFEALNAAGLNADANTAMGYQALKSNTGSFNTAFGDSVGRTNTTGSSNTAVGFETFRSNTTGNNNTALGLHALYGNTSGSDNIALGSDAGRKITGGITANQTSSTSIYLGNNTRALASGDTNEIVIGDSVTGLGSDTVVLGNSSIVSTLLRGNVTLTGELDLGTNKIVNVVDPTAAQDAATKNYVDGHPNGDDVEGPAISAIDSVPTFGATDGDTLQDPGFLFIVDGKLGVGAGNNLPKAVVDIDGLGDGVKALRFGISNPFNFEQEGVGSLSTLQLKAEFANSPFAIVAADNSNVAVFDTKTIGTSAITFLEDGGTVTMGGPLGIAGELDLGTNKIVNVVDPTAAQDAATKAYVDSVDTGDVVGVPPSVDNALMRWDGITAQSAQNSLAILSDTGVLSGLNRLEITSLILATNVISTTGSNDLVLLPGGTGFIGLRETEPQADLHLSRITGPILGRTFDSNATFIIESGSLDTESNINMIGGTVAKQGFVFGRGIVSRDGSFLYDNVAQAFTWGANVDVLRMTLGSSGVLTLTNQLDAGTNKLVNVVNPTASQDAATKAYVDSLDTGDVVGSGISIDNALARFDGTTGELIQGSLAILDDVGGLSGLTSLTAFGSDRQFQFNNAGVVAGASELVLTAGNTLIISPNSTAILGADNAFKFFIRDNANVDVLTITTISNRIGILDGDPGSVLDVGGDINIGAANTGYKIEDNTVLFADATEFNTLVGVGAGGGPAIASFRNVAVGYQALLNIGSGTEHTAIGYQASAATTNAFNTTAVGFQALNSNVSGNSVTAVGHLALAGNIGGSFNVAVGQQALKLNTDGEDNVAVGVQSLLSNLTGDNNTALGFHALEGNLSFFNTGVGSEALINHITGNSSSALGHRSGKFIADGLTPNTQSVQSLFLGAESRSLDDTVTTNEIVIGFQAIGRGSNTAVLGNDSITTTLLKGNVDVATGNLDLVAAASAYQIGGTTVLFSHATDFNVIVGLGAGESLLPISAKNNTAVGHQALNSDTTGDNQTAIGYHALFSLTGGGGLNTAIGAEALEFNLTGSANVAVGNAALRNNTGARNVAVGVDALEFNISGNDNVAVGEASLESNLTGNNNNAFGSNTLSANTGDSNTAIGSDALEFHSTGGTHVAVGFRAGTFITGGVSQNVLSSDSVYLGALTKALASGDINEIVIGFDATGIGSNSVVLGNNLILKTSLRGLVGANTDDPKAGFHLVTSGTSIFAGANRGALITDSVGPRLSFELTSAAVDQKNFIQRWDTGQFNFSTLNDAGNAFILPNILSMDGITGNASFGTIPTIAKLTVRADQAADARILLLDTERAWAFEQEGTGVNTALRLRNVTGPNKTFYIDTDGRTIWRSRDGTTEFVEIDQGTGDLITHAGRRIKTTTFNGNLNTGATTLRSFYRLTILLSDTNFTVDSADIAKIGFVFTVKASDNIEGNASTFKIVTEGSQTIDGASEFIFKTNNQVVTLVSDGSNLFINTAIQPARNIVYFTEESDLPPPVSGQIPLEANTTYIAYNDGPSVQKQILIANELLFPDAGGSRITTVGLATVLIIYTGTGNFINTTPNFTGFIHLDEMFVAAPSGTFFNVTGVLPIGSEFFPRIFMSNMGVFNTANLGTISNINVNFDVGAFFDCGQGLVLDHIEEALIGNWRFANWKNEVGSVFITVKNQLRFPKISASTFETGSNETAFNIEPSIGDETFIIASNSYRGDGAIYATGTSGSFTNVGNVDHGGTVGAIAGTPFGETIVETTAAHGVVEGEIVKFTTFSIATQMNTTIEVLEIIDTTHYRVHIAFTVPDSGTWEGERIQFAAINTLSVGDGVQITDTVPRVVDYDGGYRVLGASGNAFFVSGSLTQNATGNFNTDSLTQKDPRLLVNANAGLMDSQILAFGSMNANVGVTFITNGAYGPINTTGMTENSVTERFELTDAAIGLFTYVGFEDLAGSLLATVNSTTGQASNNEYRYTISINGVVPAFISLPYEPHTISNAKSPATLLFPVSLAQGDTVQIMVAGDGTAIDIVIDDITIRVDD